MRDDSSSSATLEYFLHIPLITVFSVSVLFVHFFSSLNLRTRGFVSLLKSTFLLQIFLSIVLLFANSLCVFIAIHQLYSKHDTADDIVEEHAHRIMLGNNTVLSRKRIKLYLGIVISNLRNLYKTKQKKKPRSNLKNLYQIGRKKEMKIILSWPNQSLLYYNRWRYSNLCVNT